MGTEVSRPFADFRGIKNGLFAANSKRPERHASRRYSLSSNEDHGDLEASIASLRSNHQEPSSSQLLPAPAIGRGQSSSRSPMRAAREVASKIFMKDSVTSSMLLPETVWTAKNNYAMDIQLLFKRRITNLYLSLTSLRSYVELNYSGFRKILKKYVLTILSGSRKLTHYIAGMIK